MTRPEAKTPKASPALQARSGRATLATLIFAAALGLAALPAAAQTTTPAESTPPAAATAAAAAPAAAADQFLAIEEEGWQTYVNGRFGTRLDYPVLFVPGEPLQGGDGRRFRSEDAMMEVFGWRNDAAETPASLAARLTEIDKYDELARREVGERSLLLAGEYDGKVFYEMYVLSGDTVQALGVEYPVARRDFYRPLVERMAASFVPGPAAGAPAVAATAPAQDAATEPAQPEATEPAQDAAPEPAPVPKPRDSAAAAESPAATEAERSGTAETRAARPAAQSRSRRQAAAEAAPVLRCGVDIECVDPGVLFSPRRTAPEAAPTRVLRCGRDVVCVGP